MEELTFMQAIARQEGFNVPGSRANRNNNPGNIVFEPWTAEFGGVRETCPSGEVPRFASFPNVDSGFNAMRTLLTNAYLGLSVQAALNKWAPPFENNDNAYLADVLDWTGLTAETVLTAENIG